LIKFESKLDSQFVGSHFRGRILQSCLTRSYPYSMERKTKYFLHNVCNSDDDDLVDLYVFQQIKDLFDSDFQCL